MTEIKNYKKIFLIVKIIVIVLAVITIGIIAYSMTTIKNVEVADAQHYTNDEIKDYVIKSPLDNNAVYLYFKYKYGKQDSIPFVEYVDVELKSRNSVKITVYEKKVVGCTEYMNKYIYFDKEGYFIEQSDQKLDDIPYVTGIYFNSITLYDKMSVDSDKLFKVILSVAQLIKKNELNIDEINFDKELNVTLYSGNIEILLGKQTTYDEQMAKLAGLLKSAKGLSGTFHLENYSDSSDNIIFDKK